MNRSLPFRLMATLVLSFLVLLAPGSAHAQTTLTAQECLAAQLRAAGNDCAGLAKCYGKAMKTGDPLSTTCLAMQKNALIAAAGEAEAIGNCLVKNEAAGVGDMISIDVDGLGTKLTLTGGRCAGMKIAALGKACAGFLRCNAMADGSSSPLDPACLAAKALRLTASFTRIESHGKCATTGDQMVLETDIAHLVDAVHVVFRGTGTTTTTATATTN